MKYSYRQTKIDRREEQNTFFSILLSFYGTSKHTYQESHFVWPEFGIQLASVEKITRAQVDNTFPTHEIIEALINNTDYQNAFNLT